MVHTEVVLQGDGGERLGRSLDIHTLLGLDSLMQTVAVAASFHHTTRLLIDDLHLALGIDDVLIVAVEQGVGLQELGDGVHALGLDRVVGEQFVLFVHLLFIGERLIGHCRQL